MKYLVLAMLGIISISAFAQNPSYAGYVWDLNLVGQNYIAVSGAGISKKVSFTHSTGYWFIKNDDACFNVTFETTLSGRNITLELNWDGLDNEQAIHHLDVKNENRYFAYRESGSGPEIMYTPDNNNSDEVRLTVKNKTYTEVEGSFEGEISTQNRSASGPGYTKVHVEGAFHFKLDKRPVISSGNFVDCDPIVYNRVGSPTMRSCSECEIKFDRWLDEHFEKAVQPVVTYFESNGFKVRQNNLHDLVMLNNHTEDHFYKVGNGTPHLLTILETEENSQFQIDGLQTISDSLVEVEKAKGNMEPAMDSIFDRAAKIVAKRKENNQGSLSIWFHINQDEKLAFNGEVANRPFNGVTFLIQAGQRKGPTNTDSYTLHLAPFETKVGLGKWTSASVQKENNLYNVRLIPAFDEKASHLSVQNLLITLKGSRENIDAALRLMDFQSLRELIYNSAQH